MTYGDTYPIQFGAGPGKLFSDVKAALASASLQLDGDLFSLGELGHRTRTYRQMHESVCGGLLRLMNLDGLGFKVLLLGGGASLQFAMAPANLFSRSPEGYGLVVDTGEWSQRALFDARVYGGTSVGLLGTKGYSVLPAVTKNWWDPSVVEKGQPLFVHWTSNNTIEGTQWRDWSSFSAGESFVVVDASSDILSENQNYRTADLIYAGAQKNLGVAGVTVVLLSARLQQFLKKESSPRKLPRYLDYQVHLESDGLYNTPPVVAVFAMAKTLETLERRGSLDFWGQVNRRKAEAAYAALEAHPEVYEVVVPNPNHRSWMNVVWRLKRGEKEFLAGAEQRGLWGLQGHRSVGGCRASLYNAVSEAEVSRLIEWIEVFAHGG